MLNPPFKSIHQISQWPLNLTDDFPCNRKILILHGVEILPCNFRLIAHKQAQVTVHPVGDLQHVIRHETTRDNGPSMVRHHTQAEPGFAEYIIFYGDLVGSALKEISNNIQLEGGGPGSENTGLLEKGGDEHGWNMSADFVKVPDKGIRGGRRPPVRGRKHEQVSADPGTVLRVGHGLWWSPMPCPPR